MLRDKVALITGASSGIGRAIALVMSREGAKIIAADLSRDGGEETAKQVRDQGGDALFVEADVARPEDGESLVAQALQRHGRLDIAVNNAGIGGLTSPRRNIRRMPGGRSSISTSLACSMA